LTNSELRERLLQFRRQQTEDVLRAELDEG
jgi:hypothetical protein